MTNVSRENTKFEIRNSIFIFHHLGTMLFILTSVKTILQKELDFDAQFESLENGIISGKAVGDILLFFINIIAKTDLDIREWLLYNFVRFENFIISKKQQHFKLGVSLRFFII